MTDDAITNPKGIDRLIKTTEDALKLVNAGGSKLFMASGLVLLYLVFLFRVIPTEAFGIKIVEVAPLETHEFVIWIVTALLLMFVGAGMRMYMWINRHSELEEYLERQEETLRQLREKRGNTPDDI